MAGALVKTQQERTVGDSSQLTGGRAPAPATAAPERPFLDTLGSARVPAPSGYLVIVQPCLQDLVQLARQRVVGLRGGRACPIAEAIGGRGRQDHSHLRVRVHHRGQTQLNGSTARAHQPAAAQSGRACVV